MRSIELEIGLKPCVAGQSADETDFKLDAAHRFTLEA